ncbi:MAG TPA: hypothetical protein VF116_14755 [Ktedonobacterales bacterium]
MAGRIASHCATVCAAMAAARDSITRCPRCGDWLQLAALSWHPPTTSTSVFSDSEPHAAP